MKSRVRNLDVSYKGQRFIYFTVRVEPKRQSIAKRTEILFKPANVCCCGKQDKGGQNAAVSHTEYSVIRPRGLKRFMSSEHQLIIAPISRSSSETVWDLPDISNIYHALLRRQMTDCSQLIIYKKFLLPKIIAKYYYLLLSVLCSLKVMLYVCLNWFANCNILTLIWRSCYR